MKPFDLQAAIAGEPVIFRNGDPYKFGAYNPEANGFNKLIGWDVHGDVMSHNEKGRYDFISENPSDYDLFMATKQKELWIAVSKQAYNSGMVTFHRTSSACEDKEQVDYLTDAQIIKITIDL